jgi:hypothetical protein
VNITAAMMVADLMRHLHWQVKYLLKRGNVAIALELLARIEETNDRFLKTQEKILGIKEAQTNHGVTR